MTLINILNKLGIDFDFYIDWLFDELKILLKDDTGFIFYEEISELLNQDCLDSQKRKYHQKNCWIWKEK